jgi:type ISP restriction-modification system protein
METSSDETAPTEDSPVANLSAFGRNYLQTLGISNPNADLKTIELLWMHALAIGYSPSYLAENAVGLRQDWPRIPLPDSKEGLLASAKFGLQIAALLNTETLVSGVTSGLIRAELRGIGVIARTGDGSLNPAVGDLAITAGWGHAGKGGITMPGQGKVTEREYTHAELDAIHRGAEGFGLPAEQVLQLLGETTCDVYLNAVAYWRNVPANVWAYTLGGYQVLKKWLSYREHKLLQRPLRPDEAREMTAIARRIAAILLLGPALNANYRDITSSTFLWPHGRLARPLPL